MFYEGQHKKFIYLSECIYIKYKKVYSVISSTFGCKTKRVRMYKYPVQNIKKVISSKGLSLWVSVSISWGRGSVNYLKLYSKIEGGQILLGIGFFKLFL